MAMPIAAFMPSFSRARTSRMLRIPQAAVIGIEPDPTLLPLAAGFADLLRAAAYDPRGARCGPR